MDTRLTNIEAAKHLGFSPSTLNNSRSTGLLAGVKAPPYRKLGSKSIFYDRADLEAWIEQFELQTSTSGSAA